MRKRQFIAKLLLAKIYFKFCYFDAAVAYFTAAERILQGNYFSFKNNLSSEYNNFLSLFFEFYCDIIHHYYNHDLLKTFEFYKNFSTILKQFSDTSIITSSRTISKHIDFIHFIVAESRKKYQKQFDEKVSNSAILLRVMNSFVLEFEENCITLQFKDKVQNKFLQRAFKANHIACTQLSGSEPDSWFQVNNLSICTVHKLEQVCQHSLFLQERFVVSESQREKVMEPSQFAPVDSPAMATVSAFSSPVFFHRQNSVNAIKSK